MADIDIVHESEREWRTGSTKRIDGKEHAALNKILSTLEPNLFVMRVDFDPNMLVERHKHASDHVIYIMEGEIIVEGTKVHAGSCITIKKDVFYGPESAGPEGCRTVIIFDGSPEQTFEDPEAQGRPMSAA